MPNETGPDFDRSHDMRREAIQFKNMELLGEGGQGRVYRGVLKDPHSDLAQTVAIKILHSETAIDLWRQEFESLRRVRSPYCVQVLSFERVAKRPALVLEYVEGVSLAQLGQTCLLGPHDLEELTAQLEQALKDLHKHDIFHGDLSPQNVLVDTSGRVRVLDFGLANGSRVTPQFASPERLRGQPADRAADLFALGRMLEFLTGRSLPESPYLNAIPEGRLFQDLSPCPDRQSELSQKVQTLLSRRKFAGSLKTRTQAVSRRKAWSCKSLLLIAITSFGVLATSSAGPIKSSKFPTKLSRLSVRTRHWHYFTLNGRPIGYSPFSLQVDSDQDLDLTWTSARGQGHKIIALKRDETRMLEDRDFSH